MPSTTVRASENGRPCRPVRDGRNGAISAHWSSERSWKRDTPPASRLYPSPFTRHALAHWRWDDGVLDTDTAKLIKAMLARFDLVAYAAAPDKVAFLRAAAGFESITDVDIRSEEHTSELQSRGHLVCRLLLEN